MRVEINDVDGAPSKIRAHAARQRKIECGLEPSGTLPANDPEQISIYSPVGDRAWSYQIGITCGKTGTTVGSPDSEECQFWCSSR
jgi:hypothetical protein